MSKKYGNTKHYKNIRTGRTLCGKVIMLNRTSGNLTLNKDEVNCVTCSSALKNLLWTRGLRNIRQSQRKKEFIEKNNEKSLSRLKNLKSLVLQQKILQEELNIKKSEESLKKIKELRNILQEKIINE